MGRRVGIFIPPFRSLETPTILCVCPLPLFISRFLKKIAGLFRREMFFYLMFEVA